MGQKKHKHHALPKGMNYADKLAHDRMVKEAAEQAVKDEAIRIRADIRAQQMMWLQVISIADAFGIGDKRILQFFDALQKNSEELEEMTALHGREYAMEKLRQRAERVSGIPIQYIYEKEIREAGARNEINGVFMPLLDGD